MDVDANADADADMELDYGRLNLGVGGPFLSSQLWHSQQFAMAIFLQTTHMHFNVCFGFSPLLVIFSHTLQVLKGVELDIKD